MRAQSSVGYKNNKYTKNLCLGPYGLPAIWTVRVTCTARIHPIIAHTSLVFLNPIPLTLLSFLPPAFHHHPLPPPPLVQPITPPVGLAPSPCCRGALPCTPACRRHLSALPPRRLLWSSARAVMRPCGGVSLRLVGEPPNAGCAQPQCVPPEMGKTVEICCSNLF
jgi:hypothetical protein